MGLISGLLGGIGIPTTGLIGQLGQGLADHSNMLLGLASGGGEGALRGAQMDAMNALTREQKDEKKRRIDDAMKWAEQNGVDPNFARSFPDLVGQIAANKYTPEKPGFTEKLFNSLNPEQKQAYIDNLTGVTKNPVEWKTATQDNQDGTKSTILYNPRDPNQRMPLVAGQQPAAGAPNPYVAQGGGTVDQNNAALYASRAAQAHSILNANESALTSQGDTIAANVPLVSNRLMSTERQKAEQAKANFLTAVLRKESGASISEGEFKQAAKVYFPEPGDPPEMIKQKRDARIAAVKGLLGSAPRGYKPPPGWENPETAGQKAPPVASQAGAQLGGAEDPYVAEARRRGLIK